MDGWKTSFLLGWPIFRGELLVSGRVLFGSIRILLYAHRWPTGVFPRVRGSCKSRWNKSILIRRKKLKRNYDAVVSESLRSSIPALEGRDPLISGLISKPSNSCSTTRVISVSPFFRTPTLEAGGRPKMPFEVSSKNRLDVVFRVDRRTSSNFHTFETKNRRVYASFSYKPIFTKLQKYYFLRGFRNCRGSTRPGHEYYFSIFFQPPKKSQENHPPNTQNLSDREMIRWHSKFDVKIRHDFFSGIDGLKSTSTFREVSGDKLLREFLDLV